MVACVTARGMSVDEVVTEVGSGMKGPCRRQAKLLADPSTITVWASTGIVCPRFGVEHPEAALAVRAQGPRD